jgi:hypothetical protein
VLLRLLAQRGELAAQAVDLRVVAQAAPLGIRPTVGRVAQDSMAGVELAPGDAC